MCVSCISTTFVRNIFRSDKYLASYGWDVRCSLPKFWRNVLPLLPWRWRQHVPPKRRQWSTRIRGVTSRWELNIIHFDIFFRNLSACNWLVFLEPTVEITKECDHWTNKQTNKGVRSCACWPYNGKIHCRWEKEETD
jgi:hypothetical protein